MVSTSYAKRYYNRNRWFILSYFHVISGKDERRAVGEGKSVDRKSGEPEACDGEEKKITNVEYQMINKKIKEKLLQFIETNKSASICMICGKSMIEKGVPVVKLRTQNSELIFPFVL